MAKRLLSKDYDKIVIETFSLRENDFYKYYQNIIDEFYSDNPEIYDDLQVALKRAKEEYNILLDSGRELKIYLDDSFFDQQIELIKDIFIINVGRKGLDEICIKRNDINNLIATYSKQRNKKTMTFESLFRDKDNARKVKEIFETREYTINGKWHGLTNDKTELLSAYYVLIPLLKPGQKITPTARIFYSEFGLSDEFIKDRTLRKHPKNIEINNEFENIFFDLLNPSK